MRLSDVAQDMAIIHSLCQQAMESVPTVDGIIANERELKACLDYMLKLCSIDEMDVSEVDELWCGKLNFSEFLLLTKELFASMHKTLLDDYELYSI